MHSWRRLGLFGDAVELHGHPAAIGFFRICIENIQRFQRSVILEQLLGHILDAALGIDTRGIIARHGPTAIEMDFMDLLITLDRERGIEAAGGPAQQQMA
ncbi:hypothetical protein [Rugamonas sp.]|uniref:hypothetical protein n=1 Tax=Rugamonas sp. TaxID=1926287 RepID=UPI0025F9A59E|nr:hypothetical protein [Rugamonas sp.]